MFADIDLRQLVEFESPTHPVLSVYLDVDPQQRSVEQYRLALRSLLSQADKAAPEDLKRVQNFVEMGYNRQSRGLVMFSCVAENFWWAQSLQVPVTDSVFVSFRAYVRQLARLLDTYERHGVIHVDMEGARLHRFNMGVLEAVEGHFGETIKQHRAGGWSAQRYQRHEMEQAKHTLQDAAELAEDFYRQADTRRLILAGTDKNVATFKGLLSHRLRSMVVGQISVKANASPSEIGEKALEIAQQAEAAEEQAMTERVITQARSKGGNAVLGLAETLTAVQTGRAQHVVVLADYVQPAYRFVESGLILLDLDEQSELHSGRLQPLPDAVDSVIRRALVQGIGVSILDQHAGLAENGKIGALTRY
jgi:peptide chain release factor subunit 1